MDASKRPEVLAIIPARSGSKSVPHKNIRSMAGKPLLAHSIGHAQASKYITRIVLNTGKFPSLLPLLYINITSAPITSQQTLKNMRKLVGNMAPRHRSYVLLNLLKIFLRIWMCLHINCGTISPFFKRKNFTNSFLVELFSILFLYDTDGTRIMNNMYLTWLCN